MVMIAAVVMIIPMIPRTATTILMGTATSMNEPSAGAALSRLMTWLSPSFPVGAFTYSHGLEWAVEDGTVTSAAALTAWLSDILRHGAGRSDAILLVTAFRAASGGRADDLREIAELAYALQPSRERRLESGAQGRAFVTAIADTWGAPTLVDLAGRLTPNPIAYPVAVAVAAFDHQLPLTETVEAYLTAFAANLVSAAVRAVPLGQTEGQRAIRDLAPIVSTVAADALLASLDDVGGACLRADIASMAHETQYTRLFRS
ncbi:urease accessory protein UreF [Pleomorphomonas sp. PLEO]|uniref:urease accessory protein UreF n=1 Tax=Pleomorphomonas sp. PLEO TaxID=3239306 RepID=UPI00351F53FA